MKAETLVSSSVFRFSHSSFAWFPVHNHPSLPDTAPQCSQPVWNEPVFTLALFWLAALVNKCVGFLPSQWHHSDRELVVTVNVSLGADGVHSVLTQFPTSCADRKHTAGCFCGFMAAPLRFSNWKQNLLFFNWLIITLIFILAVFVLMFSERKQKHWILGLTGRRTDGAGVLLSGWFHV